MWGSLLAVAVVVVGVLIGLAANPATGQAHWPWGLDGIRRHPFPSVAVFLGMAVVLAVVQPVLAQRMAPVPKDPPVPPVPVVPAWVVDREQARQVALAVREHSSRGAAVGITTGIHGAGGFGKTTVALLVRTDRLVRREFRGRIYQISIGRDVRGRAAIAAKVAEATRFITGDTSAFEDPVMAGEHLGRLLAGRPRTLLILDDVWEAEQLAPFLIGAQDRCVRLVTTRVAGVLPVDGRRVVVDRMSDDQARRILTEGLPRLSQTLVHELVEAAGGWALVLRLTNEAIAKAVRRGAAVESAAAAMLLALRQDGPGALGDPMARVDVDDPVQRAKTVRATIEASVAFLPVAMRASARFAELGVFAEDESVPVSLIVTLWRSTAGYSANRAEALCAALADVSLITWVPEGGGRVALHNVVRDYLRAELGAEGIKRVNAALMDAVAASLPAATRLEPSGPDPCVAWWQAGEGYLLDHGIEHLVAAGDLSRAEAVAGDVRWVETRLRQRSPAAAIRDLELVPTKRSAARARDLARAAHLLAPSDPTHALTAILHSRLGPLPGWRHQVTALRHPPAAPTLRNQRDPPDLPDPALLRILVGHTDPVPRIAVSPDGQWLATAVHGSEEVRIWDPATGEVIRTLIHDSRVSALAALPGGGSVASGSHDGTVRIWDAATGVLLGTFETGDGALRTLAVSPDAKWLVTSGLKGVQIWDLATGSLLATPSCDAGVSVVMISPDCTWLLMLRAEFGMGEGDGMVQIWDLATQAVVAEPRGCHFATAVALSPDGSWVAIGSRNGEIRAWDLAMEAVTDSVHVHCDVRALAIAPDGTWLAIGSKGGPVQIWDRSSGALTATASTKLMDVWALAISPNGDQLITSEWGDGTVRIWDRAAAMAQGTASTHPLDVRAVALAPDGTWLATADGGRTLRIWDLATGAVTATVDCERIEVFALSISADGEWLAIGGDAPARELQFWNRITGTISRARTMKHSRVRAVAFSPDSTWLATAGIDDTAVRLWDPATGTNTATLHGHTHDIWSLAISPDGTWLATASCGMTYRGGNGSVRLWDRATGTNTATLRAHTNGARAVAISPDGTWLASADAYDGTVLLWDRATGACTATLRGHTTGVWALAISPDGAWLATVGIDDGTILIWDSRTRRTAAMMRTDGGLTSCTWTPNGDGIVVGGRQGVYFFEFTPGTSDLGSATG